MVAEPWFVFHLSNAPLAIKTMKRLELRYLYPYRTVRRPRKPDILEPLLGNYALVTFDPDEPVPLRFEGGTRRVPWPVLQDLPGVIRIFHNGAVPRPVREDLSAEIVAASSLPIVYEFRPGDVTRVLAGPFVNFEATIVKADAGNVEAWVSIFGRSTLLSISDTLLAAPPGRTPLLA